MNDLDLDLNYNNVASEVLTKNNPTREDIIQQPSKYVNWANQKTSSAEGDESKGSKLDNILNAVPSWIEAVRGTGDDGQTPPSNDAPNTPTEADVKILGMKPLVFTIVALGTVVLAGVAIVVIKKKAVKR
jgi:hypothetical protein